jgi:SAM-dependent methyltransferase
VTDRAPYDVLAPFYDHVTEEPVERIRQILALMTTYRPDAESVLELGCGTGAVLAGLGSGFRLVGIDQSPSMLSVAERRLPGAELHLGDITNFDLGATFDVAVCVFDTMNHVTTIEGWRSVIACTAAHLVDGGLFIFDCNTVGRLAELGSMAPWVHEFEGHTLITSVNFDEPPLAVFDVRVFEARGDVFVQHREVIVERAVALAEIRTLLSEYFDVVSMVDDDEQPATDDSVRVIVAARRRWGLELK